MAPRIPRIPCELILLMVVTGGFTLQAKEREWQSGEVASMEIIRSTVGHRLIYHYSYSVRSNGHTYTFDEKNRLRLTVNGPVKFEVRGDKLRVVDERGKEHAEAILEKAIDPLKDPAKAPTADRR